MVSMQEPGRAVEPLIEAMTQDSYEVPALMGSILLWMNALETVEVELSCAPSV